MKVDVLFSPKFFGEQYCPSGTLKCNAMTKLFTFYGKIKDRLIITTRKTSARYIETLEIFKRYLKFTLALKFMILLEIF